MRISGVLARFLPLLDIAILLLGLFVVLSAIARQTERARSGSPDRAGGRELSSAEDIPENPFITGAARRFVESQLAPIWIYACCDGEFRNRCRLMEDDFVPGRVIDIDSDRDIQELIEARKPRRTVIFVMIEEGGFDRFWDERRGDIEAVWNAPVVWIRNVRLSSL
ncbi:MAG: hypothetical protein IIZ25_07340 [Thermoguttaceae bacterium]|nr:hypothetical protein [Thermoguttaceae bacterium]